jgi:hypothetical protein
MEKADKTKNGLRALVIDDEYVGRIGFTDLGEEFFAPEFKSYKEIKEVLESEKFGVILLDGSLEQLAEKMTHKYYKSDGDRIANELRDGLYGILNQRAPIMSISGGSESLMFSPGLIEKEIGPAIYWRKDDKTFYLNLIRKYLSMP